MNNDALGTTGEDQRKGGWMGWMDGVDGAMIRWKGSEEESLKGKSRMAISQPGVPLSISVTLVFSTWS